MEEKIVKKLIYLSKKAEKIGEVPVSCVIVYKNQIIAADYNKKIKLCDPMAHAEILAIKKACKVLKTPNLNECIMYVTLKPCKMCEDVIVESRLKNVFYILESEKNVKNTVKFVKISNIYCDFFKKQLKNFFVNKR